MRSRASVCSVGLVEVKDGVIVQEKYTLVNPHDRFDPFCVAVHGITPGMVEDAPSFPEVWEDIRSLIEGRTLVAHNASFDMSVLRGCMDAFGFDYPDCTYVCSYLLSRKIWPGLPGYKLNQMAAYHGLSGFRHHDALEDARIAAQLLLKCFEQSAGAADCPGLAEACGYRLGALFPGGTYATFTSAKAASKGSKRKGAAGGAAKAGAAAGAAGVNSGGNSAGNSGGNSGADFGGNSGGTRGRQALTPAPAADADINHALYGKNIVFTGRLGSLTRKEAMQRAAECGGRCGETVELQTHYLVVGQNDFIKLQSGGARSSKIQKADRLAGAGLPVRLISEQQFLALLGETAASRPAAEAAGGQ